MPAGRGGTLVFLHEIRRAGVNRRGEQNVFGDVTTMELPLGTMWGRSRARTSHASAPTGHGVPPER